MSVPWDIFGEILSHIKKEPQIVYYAYVNSMVRIVSLGEVSYELKMGLRVDDSSSISSSYIDFKIECKEVISIPYRNELDSSGPYSGFISGTNIKTLRIRIKKGEGVPQGIPLDRIPGLPKLIDIIQNNKKILSREELIDKIKKEVPEVGWTFKN